MPSGRAPENQLHQFVRVLRREGNFEHRPLFLLLRNDQPRVFEEIKHRPVPTIQ